MACRVAQRGVVAVCAQAAHQPHGGVGQVGMVPERLALKDIGQMYFNERNAHSGQRIAYRDAGVRVGGRVDDDEIGAVASGSLRKTVLLTLQCLGLQDAFGAVVAAEDVRRQKPAPDIFLEAARRLNVPPGACCAYEDGEFGLQAIRAAGMTAVDIRRL